MTFKRFSGGTIPFLFLLAALAWVSMANSSAQTAPKFVGELAFKVSPQRLLNSDVGKTIGLSEEMLRNNPDPSAKVLLQATLIEGLIDFPSDFQTLMQRGNTNHVPADVFMKIQFEKPSQVEELKKAWLPTLVPAKQGGENFYKANEPGLNLYFAFEGNSVRIGTEAIFDPSNASQMTERLKTTWAAQPDTAARLVWDVESSRPLIDAAVKEAKRNLPPDLAPFLKIPSQISLVQMGIDLDQATLLSLIIDSPNADDAKELGQTLQGLVAMEVAGLMQAPSEAPFAPFFGKMLQRIDHQVDDQRITLTLKKPANFNQELAAGMKAYRETAKKIAALQRYKEVILSVLNYESAHRRFPFHASEKDNASLSWRVRVLPFLEDMPTYKRFKRDEPWNSAANEPLARQVPDIFKSKDGKTNICWIQSDVNNYEDITDGASNTIALLENPQGVNWSEPADLTIDQAVELYRNLKPGESLMAARYDGFVFWIRPGHDVKDFRAMLTPAGGEVVHWED